MRLLRLKADGFGPLRGEFSFAPDRLTLVVDENERGKSSLLGAVHAALYGLEDDRRGNRTLTARERWRPWDGGTYRLELELEAQGERYTVVRDFERGKTEVWTGAGREVTDDFREGKDEFPVGKKLLGLDASEFEKCALVRQGELEHVVPPDERGRRDSTLRARLESAADARVGDTNAIEAIEALTRAAATYTCDELGRTIMVENAIRELELLRATCETELNAIEHDLARNAQPLEELARLAEDEKAARDALGRLEREWRTRRAGEARTRLELDRECRTDLARLTAEAEALASFAGLPPNAEAVWDMALARLDEAERRLETLDASAREDEQARARIERDLAELEPFAAATAADADALAARAGELARLGRDLERLDAELEAARAAVVSRGFDARRVEDLTRRFLSLPYDQQALLRDEPRQALDVQIQVAEAETSRHEGLETLREIDALRNRRRIPGWIALAVAVATVTAAGLGVALAMPWPWLALLAGGGAVAMIAVAMLIVGSRAGRDEREAAEQGVEEAEQHLHSLRVRQISLDGRLQTLAAALGLPDVDELRSEWNEYQRMAEESAQVQQVQHRTAALVRQRDDAIDEARALLDRAGGGLPDPERLDLAAASIRRRLAARDRSTELERGRARLEEQRRPVLEIVRASRVSALELLERAGLAGGEGRTLRDHATELTRRARGRDRHARLTDDVIPSLRKALLDDRTLRDLEEQAGGHEPQTGEPASHEGADAARSLVDLEAEIDALRRDADALGARRSDRRPVFEERARALLEARVEREARLERLDRALTHAQRFKHATDLARATIESVARETHRRWAEFLNLRVSELLSGFGTGVTQVRFGEDLDFSVRLPHGTPTTRGRAALQLSCGARDQLHLAVRIAVSEYLSRGREPIPLLIDDAFATSDDERARAGMRLLIERLAARHQIVVVTCHRKRHETFAAQDPDLYASRVAWVEPRTEEVRA